MIILCDEGKQLYSKFKRLEALETERMKTATKPFELSEEFYDAANDYIIHVDNCDECYLSNMRDV